MEIPEAEIIREGLFDAINEQMRDSNPPATKQAFDRMIDEGISKDEAMKLIAAVLLMEMNQMLKEGKAYNEERYVGELNALPELPLDD